MVKEKISKISLRKIFASLATCYLAFGILYIAGEFFESYTSFSKTTVGIIILLGTLLFLFLILLIHKGTLRGVSKTHKCLYLLATIVAFCSFSVIPVGLPLLDFFNFSTNTLGAFVFQYFIIALEHIVKTFLFYELLNWYRRWRKKEPVTSAKYVFSLFPPILYLYYFLMFDVVRNNCNIYTASLGEQTGACDGYSNALASPLNFYLIDFANFPGLTPDLLASYNQYLLVLLLKNTLVALYLYAFWVFILKLTSPIWRGIKKVLLVKVF